MSAVLLRPEAAIALLLAPVAWLLVRGLERRGVRRLQRWIGPREPVVAAERHDRRRSLRHGAFALGLLFGLAAALGPVFGATAPRLAWRGVDLVVCLDVSRSMGASDVAPTRLDRALAEIRGLAERVEGDRLGLVVFAGEARRRVPLTADARSFTVIAEQSGPSDVERGGTNLGAALDAARDALDVGAGDAAAVLLVTDGEDHEGRGREAAERLGADGVRVHVLALGTPEGSKIAVEGSDTGFLEDARGRDVVSRLDRDGLRGIADATGGAYREAGPTPGALTSVYEEEVLPRARAPVEAEGRRRADRYPWFLAVALLFWGIDLALGDRRRP